MKILDYVWKFILLLFTKCEEEACLYYFTSLGRLYRISYGFMVLDSEENGKVKKPQFKLKFPELYQCIICMSTQRIKNVQELLGGPTGMAACLCTPELEY
jgi:hypothetical protein